MYPPSGPPPPVLPPLPALPALTPLHAPPSLGPSGMTRLITLWDCCNVLGETFGLKPLVAPLDAIAAAV